MSFSQSFFAVGSPGAESENRMHETTGTSSGPGAVDAPHALMKDGDEDAQALTQGPQESSSPRVADRDDQPGRNRPEKMASETAEGPEHRSGTTPLPTATIAGMKKKGKASIVKAPKRARPGAKKSKPGAKKKTPGSAKAAAGKEQQDAGDESSESDSGPYCICRGPDNHLFMIACDKCEDWFHGECIGMDKYTGENLVQRYICPNCTDGKMYVTRYKKTCSLERCEKPARIYEPNSPSIFCCDEHCQAWWEQLIATLPKSKSSHLGDLLTQRDFMGLVSGSARKPGDQNGAWKLGDDPFGVPPDFWDTVDPQDVLTEEQLDFLAVSAAHRHGLGEEIVLCKKMLQLVDMAQRRREAAIAASAPLGKGQALGKDFCGYDDRLDTVGATAAFAAFARSPQGETIFRAGRLDAPPPGPAEMDGDHPGDGGDEGKDNNNSNSNTAVAASATAGMCVKKKCKPHMQWSSILTKAVKHQIKELAAQAKEKLDAEERVRSAAAVRYRRRLKENNWVTVIESDSEMEVD